MKEKSGRRQTEKQLETTRKSGCIKGKPIAVFFFLSLKYRSIHCAFLDIVSLYIFCKGKALDFSFSSFVRQDFHWPVHSAISTGVI
jgi:hypothetical protein